MNNWMFLGGSAALLTVIASCWNQVRTLITQISSYVIISYDLTGVSGYAGLAFLQENYKCTRFGTRSFSAFRAFVRPRHRYEMVAAEFLGGGAQIYWAGWWPLWVSRIANDNKDRTDNLIYRPIRLTCFRGTIDIKEFLLNAVDFLNQYETVDDFGNSDQNRYQIRHITGTAGKPMSFSKLEPVDSDTPDRLESCNRSILPLRYRHSELGPDIKQAGNAIEHLALPTRAVAMVEEVRRWYESRNWHEERGVPWKRGYCLYGEPGTGKTALVRAIAEDLNLPVYVYDLASLFNDELRTAWTEMLCKSPCIALFEDIDAVFDKRTKLAGEVSFDCLLNCLDGIDRSDGLLTVITTNHIEKLDEALGGGYRPRPGRIDQLIEMLPPSVEGRKKIARRILTEWPETWDALVDEGQNDTGAQFEHRCRSKALELYYENDLPAANHDS